ncbi:MAG: element excision factor XisH family protein [Caldilineaceae bacterium]
MEIKELRGQSVIVELEQAIGQYVLYRLLLNQVDPERHVYLAIPDKAYRELFTEPIGELVINDLPLQLLVVDIEQCEVKKWIPHALSRNCKRCDQQISRLRPSHGAIRLDTVFDEQQDHYALMQSGWDRGARAGQPDLHYVA